MISKFIRESGFDCISLDRTATTEDIIKAAKAQDRILITSNVKIFNKKMPVKKVCIKKGSPTDQFKWVNEFFNFSNGDYDNGNDAMHK